MVKIPRRQDLQKKWPQGQTTGPERSFKQMAQVTPMLESHSLACSSVSRREGSNRAAICFKSILKSSLDESSQVVDALMFTGHFYLLKSKAASIPDFARIWRPHNFNTIMKYSQNGFRHLALSSPTVFCQASRDGSHSPEVRKPIKSVRNIQQKMPLTRERKRQILGNTMCKLRCIQSFWIAMRTSRTCEENQSTQFFKISVLFQSLCES